MKICLDAGHFGKYNQSPAEPGYYESEMTWKLHLLQKKYLESYGIEVVLTRERQQEDKGLYVRGASSKGCDLFISDHSNAVGNTANSRIDYPCAYCVINGSADGIGMALAQTVETVLGTRQPARIEHRRGQNGDYYGVLRGAAAVGTPGLILEHSFHTNGAIARWLLNPDNLDRLAKAETAAILLYYNINQPEPENRWGWYQEEGGWRFYLGNTGEPVRNSWYKDGEDWYWFDGAGMMVSNTWKTDSAGKWYYLGGNGAMKTDTWVIWKHELYRLKKDGSMFEGVVCLQSDEKGALIPGKAEEKKGLFNKRKGKRNSGKKKGVKSRRKKRKKGDLPTVRLSATI